VTCVVGIDEQTGELVTGPDIVSRGFIYVRDNEAMLDEAADVVAKAIRKQPSRSVHADNVKTIVHDVLAHFFYERTHRRPMILPMVLEV
jgi:ribonuclease J